MQSKVAGTYESVACDLICGPGLQNCSLRSSLVIRYRMMQKLNHKEIMDALPSPLFSLDLRLTLGQTLPQHHVFASVDQKVKQSALGFAPLELVSALAAHCSQHLVPALHLHSVWLVHAVGQ